MLVLFWRSVDLTGNQTREDRMGGLRGFWRSVDLTGNQTYGFRDQVAILVLAQCRFDW